MCLFGASADRFEQQPPIDAIEVALYGDVRDAGLPAVMLRNGWYTENHLPSLQAALENGAFMGAADGALYSSAARADYAAAAAAALTGESQAGRVYELAGDDAFTPLQLAAEVAQQAGKPVRYQDMSEADYRPRWSSLVFRKRWRTCSPMPIRTAVRGALFDDKHVMSGIIGRPTTPMQQSVAASLRA